MSVEAQPDASAGAIYRAVLDALTHGLRIGDVAACQRHLAVPFRMHLLDRTHVCITREDIAKVVQNYHQTMQETGMTDLHRKMEVARFVAPNRIEGYHVTTPQGPDGPVVEPYAIRSVLELIHGRWVSTEQEVIVKNSDWPVLPGAYTSLPEDDGARNRTSTPPRTP